MISKKIITAKEKDIFSQFYCFAFVGIFGTACHYIILISFVNLVYDNPLWGSILGSVVGASVNYLLNYHWTFQSKKKHRETMIKFYTVASSGLILNAIIMALTVELLNIYYLFSQLLATIIVLFWNFLANKIWTFKQKSM